MKISKILKKNFGFSEFRNLQQETIEAIIKNKDVLTILPTGGGKSLCYQLPALYFENKITIVISPLIALINDQVINLENNNIKVAKLTSELNGDEIKDVYRKIYNHEISLLYVSPERANMESFKNLIKEIDVAFFVIDEAHCVSEWGHEFRPDYRKLNFLKEEFAHIPIAAFTATATKKVAVDIVNSLKLNSPEMFCGSFFRKNLIINVIKRVGNGRVALIDFLKNYKNESGIIYTFTRKECEELADFLQEKKINALSYHAGIDKNERKLVQEKFIKDEIKIVVATIAFGMGIDKSNVRFVVHMDLPKSIEGYYQEIGRAGRDGLKSECLLMYSRADVVRKSELLEDIEDINYKKFAKNKLEQMYAFAQSYKCRHQFILEYFEENIHECGTLCDNCKKDKKEELFNITKEAQKLLSAIYRTNQQFGKTYIVDILRGSKSKKILENEHNNLSVYGIGHELSKEQWDFVIDKLFEIDAISHGEFKELKINQKGIDILKAKEELFINFNIFEKITNVSLNQEIQEVDENFELLRDLRTEIAKKESVPAYIIFSDQTLKEMSKKLPTTEDEFLKITGVGEIKLKKYGEEFLALIKELKPTTLSDTLQKTFDLISTNKSIKEMALERNFAESTILSHVNKIFEAKKIDENTKERLFQDYLKDIPAEFITWYKKGKEIISHKDSFLTYLHGLNHIF